MRRFTILPSPKPRSSSPRRPHLSQGEGSANRPQSSVAPGEPKPRTHVGPIILPVVEEAVAVRRRKVETGKVRVRKIVREHVADVTQPVLREEVLVERVPIGRIVTARPETRQEGDTLVIPVLEEVLVKELRLIEEIRIRKLQRVERHTRKVPLRKEEVIVERGSGTGRDAAPEMDQRPG